MSRHRAAPRPRYGRIAVLCVSLGITALATLGGIGVLPSQADQEAASIDRAVDPEGSGSSDPGTDAGADSDSGDDSDAALAAAPDSSTVEPDPAAEQAEAAGSSAADEALPADSGEGRRVVFSEGRQRVWLVGERDRVERTYAVSGSVEDNLDPGTYQVFSRSEDAVGIDDSGTMKFFVRFTRGPSGAAIGFHDIPVKDGEQVQTRAQLGTPLSHGCIRQKRSDAVALWEFAPLDTTVVVTA